MAQDIHGCNRYWMKRTIGNKMRGTLENHGLGSKPAFTTSSLNIAKTLLTADGSSPLNHASKSAAETEDANSFKIFGLPSKGANSQPGEAPRRFIIEPTKKVSTFIIADEGGCRAAIDTSCEKPMSNHRHRRLGALVSASQPSHTAHCIQHILLRT
ncbi:MAG: hypothetical protein J3Q66DRAFT_407674 [Benniella sp.]|nr:MAG: hypothetical protein J3Q66DRAFT_407674 [Benniella sp.]